MRLCSSLFAFVLLAATPALAAKTAASHAEPAHAEESHGDGHGDKAHAESKPPNTEQVGLTAAIVLLLVGSGAGLLPILREQLK